MLAQDFTVCAFSDRDIDEIVGLYERAAVTEPGLGPVARSAWQRFLKLPQNADGRDFLVARQDAAVIALAESHLKYQPRQLVRFCKFVVDPAFRRRGVASALLRAVLQIDQEDDSLAYQCLVSGSWAAGLAFVNKYGFVHIESEFSMRCSQLAPGLAAAPSSMVIERAANPQSWSADIARIHNAAHCDDASFHPFTAEEMTQALDSDEVWIARDDSGVLAFCHLKPEAGLIWLENIAVHPVFQGRGVGTALLQQALLPPLRHGRPAALNVSSKNSRAISLYERLGFKTYRERRRFCAMRSGLVAALARDA
jgi:ribosomal protein S18 acetylase RimI-like enzyme